MTTPRMRILAVEMIPSHSRSPRPSGSRTPWIKAHTYGLSPESRVMNAVAQRRNDRHRRLQNKTKCHRAAGSIENVLPEATKAFLCDPIPGHSEDEEYE